eukprot:14989387-Heterocapsa_arctica.AAC.1
MQRKPAPVRIATQIQAARPRQAWRQRRPAADAGIGQGSHAEARLYVTARPAHRSAPTDHTAALVGRRSHKIMYAVSNWSVMMAAGAATSGRT